MKWRADGMTSLWNNQEAKWPDYDMVSQQNDKRMN
jgi:hypothetical protein